MDIKISNNANRNDYEILIRKRGFDDYAAYCPQLNLIIKGNIHEEVTDTMENEIAKHISNLSAAVTI